MFLLIYHTYFILADKKEGSIIKHYGFRIGKGDENIDTLLNSMTPRRRSQYMKDAIMFYVSIGSELKELNSHIKQILISNLEIKNTKDTDIKKETDNEISEDILLSSMEDLLGL